MLEIEVIGIDAVAVAARAPTAAEMRASGGSLTREARAARDAVPTAAEVRDLCARALARAGIAEGHLAIEFVAEDRIRKLNRDHRQIDAPTDVLSFGIDEAGPCAGPRELGDIVICARHTDDLREAVVHGALHLGGMDHEADAGEMLAIQAELMRGVEG